MTIPNVDFPHFDFIAPAVIIAACLLIMAIVWRVSLPKRSVIAVSDLPQVAPPPLKVAGGELQRWHAAHGPTVQSWIEQHEEVLQRVSAKGLQFDLMTENLTASHDSLADAMRDAITSHPAPAMRAQLSALVVSSEATLHALRRSEYQDAERQHVTYLQYRDSWLQRLRQFSHVDANIRHLQTIPDQTPPTESIWLTGG